MDNNLTKLLKSTKDLASLIKLEQNARSLENPSDLYDYIVHNTRQLVNYEFAALWLNSSKKIVEISDVDIDEKSNFIDVLKNIVAKNLQQKKPINKLDFESLDENFIDPAKRHLFKNTIVIHLTLHEKVVAALILSREESWPKREFVLIEHIMSCYALCLGYMHPQIVQEVYFDKVKRKLLNQKNYIIAGFLAFFILFFLQVNLTVLAPAEVSSKKPVYIRSKIDGVIEKIYISPNVYVEKGTKILSLNKDNIEAQLNILDKKMALAATQHKVSTKSGYGDKKQKQKIPVLKMEIEKTLAEIEYYQYLLAQADIYAPKSGLVLFDQTHKLEGKPVNTGENIMLLSDQEESALDIFLPVSDAISLEKNAKIKFFLNTSPRDPVGAKIIYASYQAELTPDGTLSYHIKATFDEKESENLPRIGLRGVAKLYGDDVPLIYYLLRKPLSYLRQKLGV